MSAADRKPPILLANLAAFVGTTFTAGSIVAVRFVIAESDPASLAFIRYSIGFVCLLPIAFYLMRGRRIGVMDGLIVLVLGAMFFGAFPYVLNLSLKYTSAARGSLVLATAPVMTLMLASLLRSERLTAAKLVGVIGAFAGVAVAMLAGPGGLSGPGGLDSAGAYWTGDLLMLAAAAMAAVYTIYAKPLLGRHPALAVTALSMLGGLLVLAPFAQAQGTFSGLPSFSPAGWFAVAFLGICGAAMQFGLWIWAISKLSPTQAAIYLTLTPVTAVILASLILGEPVSLGLFAGLALVIGGILLANRPAPAANANAGLDAGRRAR
ncbi:MAG: DMT family transporter [Alphaproteobacteria bacterium]